VPVLPAGPDEVLVLDQQTGFIGNVEPLLRRRADAEPEAVPVHLLRDFSKHLPNPRFLPGEGSRLRIFEEAMQGDIRAPQEVNFAVEVGASGRCVEAELAHAKPGPDTVAASPR